MEIKEFIESLKKSNFSLAVENEKLVLKGDRKILGKEEIQAIQSNEFIINYIKEHKSELVEYLSFTVDKLTTEKKSKNITAIYPMSGLQEGILFHGLYNEGTGAYLEQFTCNLTGIEVATFIKSWDYVLRKHSILRSSFLYDQASVPIQCVYAKVQLPVEVLDLSELSDDEQLKEISNYEETDLTKPFNFKVAPLIRIGLFRLQKNRYHMVWTSHHLLFDGWSIPILMQEFLTNYELVASGKEVNIGEEDRYEDYIRYIERNSKEQQETYWRNYLNEVEQSTLLPFITNSTERNKGGGEYGSVVLELNNNTTAKVKNFAQSTRVTVNTVMQAVWSFLLHKYTGNRNITYGVVVSGRPDNLPNVEQRVGLYINTLPLRSAYKNNYLLTQWLHSLQSEQVRSREYQYT
ncbi:MAG: condensation domain-containing protein, partial [Segetibacter sp.]